MGSPYLSGLAGVAKKILGFFRTYQVAAGLIAGSVIFPLMVGYVKTQWDMANWKQQTRADDLRARHALSLKNRADALDDLYKAYGSFNMAARFLVLDAELGRLESELGRDHRRAYESEMRGFFKDQYILLFK